VKRGVLTAVLLAVALVPNKADSTGVYENAAAESAFLFSPRQIVLRASLEGSRDDVLNGTIYRIYAAFPVRNHFQVALEQPLVTTNNSRTGLDSGIGDLMVRVSARIVGEEGGLYALGSLGAGTGDQRLFPYSSESVDIGFGLAYRSSPGPVDFFATSGYVWAQRVPESESGVHDNYARFSLGTGFRVGENTGLRVGVVRHLYTRFDARRDIVFAATGYRWTEAMRFFAEGQMETGPVGERASDWAVTAGILIRY